MRARGPPQAPAQAPARAQARALAQARGVMRGCFLHLVGGDNRLVGHRLAAGRRLILS